MSGSTHERVPFQIKRVKNSSSDYAAACFRAAVLYPLFGPDNRQYERTSYIADRTLELIELRRKRLHDLKQIGWKPAVTYHNWYENCPPFGVHTSKPVKSCHLAYFCPFCWARGFIQPVLKAALELYPERYQGVGIKNPDALEQAIEHKDQRILLYRDKYHCYSDLRQRLAQEQRCVTVGRQRITANRKHHVGSVMISTASPIEKGWSIERRRMTLVATGGDEPELSECDPEFPKGTSEAIYCIRTGDVIRAVASTLSYPQWLMTGDVGKVREWLEARQGLRLASKCGKLRASR